MDANCKIMVYRLSWKILPQYACWQTMTQSSRQNYGQTIWHLLVYCHIMNPSWVMKMIFNTSATAWPHYPPGAENLLKNAWILIKYTDRYIGSYLTNIFTMDWLLDYVCLDVCPKLSTPKPLDQLKNATERTYHKLWEDKNGQKKLAKQCQKMPKRA